MTYERTLSAARRESGLIQRVRASLLRGFPDPASPHILVACSGGRDSVVLAHLVQQLVRMGLIRATIAHIDHALRPDSADAARMVQAFASRIGLPARVARLSADAVNRHPGMGLEEALRRERYLALAGIAGEIAADAVALAHHQGDQAETVLLHLVRGAGLHGAAGMREWSLINVPWWVQSCGGVPLKLWRPLLPESGGQIASWHSDHNLPLYEDSTNQDLKIRRNAIRHIVLPHLEDIVPGATANLARFADLAAEDNEVLEGMAEERASVERDGSLHRKVIVDAPRAIQRRIVRQWILGRMLDIELTANRIDAVCRLAKANRSGSRVEVGGGWAVQIDRGVLSLVPALQAPCADGDVASAD
ncbi:MAG TPA: tRNA lysidine(34) synthetase TilS [Thermomicrobiales bacterium]|nr:tRNA lysidine(34) synthetase TilS [Thermomicrobiales bacterium]